MIPNEFIKGKILQAKVQLSSTLAEPSSASISISIAQASYSV